MEANTWKSYENGMPEKTNSSSSDSQGCSSAPLGPDPAKLNAILDRTSRILLCFCFSCFQFCLFD